jgi:hypothetical protein
MSPSFNDAQKTFLAAYYLLESLNDRLENLLKEDDAVEISYAIDAVRIVLDRAYDQYGELEARYEVGREPSNVIALNSGAKP